MIIIIFFGAIFIGILLAGILAPLQMFFNRKTLKEMDVLIEAFENKTFSSPEEKEISKRNLKKELIKLKSKILIEPKATEEASDKINLI